MELAFFIGMFVLFVILHAILLTIPFIGKTEAELEEINKATEEWIKAHPIVSFCFFFPTTTTSHTILCNIQTWSQGYSRS